MVRRANLDELSKIVEMKLEMYKEDGLDDLLADDVYNKVLVSYQKLYRQDKVLHFVVEKNGKIIACAGGFIKEDIPYSYFKTSYYGFIGDVYTYPKYRKNGYATKLTSQVISWLKEQDVKVIRLLASEQGRSIYEKLGFKATDEMVLDLY
ncbi:hypothetical protein U472_02360 [Orenia metallireducens]|uniref:N-acetyltransferase domain-containing protein n=1 Tax=Orenia metallireducens TaxID=1413210 RepID=A0A1C0ACF9_9FIRM|nr:GNAT family N-acetyltransferase [Orenia metallireducens]OCL28061.1 hypothetical protein U472_02360 [Orenia metallireducens]